MKVITKVAKTKNVSRKNTNIKNSMSVEVFNKLVESGWNLNKKSRHGSNAFIRAIKNDDINLVNHMLKNKKIIKFTNSEIKKGNYKLIEVLSVSKNTVLIKNILNSRINFDVNNTKPPTPLSIALKYGNDHFNSYLIKKALLKNINKNNINLKNIQDNIFNILSLLKKEKDLKIIENCLRTVIKNTPKDKKNPNLKKDLTNFMLEVSINNQNILQMLLDKFNANPDYISPIRKSSLLIKLLFNEYSYNRDSIIILLKSGASSSKLDNNQECFLIECIKDRQKSRKKSESSLDLLNLIFKYGKANLKINQTDKDGNTALHYAVMNGDINLVKLLIKKGASTLLKNSKGLLPLDYSFNLFNDKIKPYNNYKFKKIGEYLNKKEYNKKINLLEEIYQGNSKDIKKEKFYEVSKNEVKYLHKKATKEEKLAKKYFNNRNANLSISKINLKSKKDLDKLIKDPKVKVFTTFDSYPNKKGIVYKDVKSKSVYSGNSSRKYSDKTRVHWELVGKGIEKKISKRKKKRLDVNINQNKKINLKFADFTKSNQKFIVHTTKSTPDILEKTLETKANNILKFNPLISTSIIDKNTPPCQAGHQGNQLFPINLVFKVHPDAIQWTSNTDCSSPTGNKLARKVNYLRRKKITVARTNALIDSYYDHYEKKGLPLYSHLIEKELEKDPLFKKNRPYLRYNKRGGTGRIPVFSPESVVRNTGKFYNEIIISRYDLPKGEDLSKYIKLVGISVDKKQFNDFKKNFAKYDEKTKKSMIKSLEILEKYSKKEVPLLLVDINMEGYKLKSSHRERNKDRMQKEFVKIR